MALKPINYGYNTRSIINAITARNNYNISRSQASHTLKQFIKSSLRRLKTTLQINFMKECKQQKVFSTRIDCIVRQLDLQHRQSTKLKEVIIKRDIRRLYSELSKKNKIMNTYIKGIKDIFTKNDVDSIYTCWYNEKEYMIVQAKSHYDSRMEWFKEKQRNKEDEILPSVIDNINMTDQQLPAEFNCEPPVYGRIQVSEKEKQLLKLPPKYALFQKPDTLMIKSQFEKAITQLRWSIKIENDNKGKEGIKVTDVIDLDNKIIDFSNIRARDLPFNKRVVMPPYADKVIESKIAYARQKINKIIENHENENKYKEYSNLSREEKEGLNTLKKKANGNQIICYITDKSGKMSVDSPENYLAAMQPHLQETKEVKQRNYNYVENIINSHMQAWCNIIKADKRVYGAFQATDTDIPPQYGLRKDHKIYEDMDKGPPTRPVCGAVTSCNYRFSYFLSMILKPFIILSEETCESTEDLIHRVNYCNQVEELDDSVIGSFDVESLYPSIDIDFSVEKCMEIILEHEIEFKNVDILEVGLYVSHNVNAETRQKDGIYNYCPTRRTVGRTPTITSQGKAKKEEIRWSGWRKPLKSEDIPNNIKRSLIVRAISIALKVILENHIFVFNKRYYKQTKGGAIGVSIAGDVANLFLVWWDRELKRRLIDENIHIKLYSRYVDDGCIVIKKIHNENIEGNSEKYTMNTIKDIANGIHESIVVKVDYPSKNENKRLAILDTEMWIEKVNVNGIMKCQIIYSHYMKPMSNRYVVHFESAMSYSSKINILTNELIRIFKNISTHVNKAEKENIIQYFIQRLIYSGYPQRERITIYRKAKQIYEKRLNDDKEGICPMYRSKKWKQTNGNRGGNKKEWYKNKGYKSTFFVDATQNESLAKECTKVLKECELPIKVIQKCGISIKKTLSRSNPFRENKCKDDKCSICTADSNIYCKKRECVYENTCEDVNTCNGAYIGESSETIRKRYTQHLYDYSKRRKCSSFLTHCIDYHNGDKKNLNVNVIRSCTGDPMLRQCMEAVLIREMEPKMNSRAEWGNSNAARGNLVVQ